jgi:tetratricopeptide (TPR) repeat protein
MRIRALLLSLSFVAVLARVPLSAQQTMASSDSEERQLLHRSADWALIAPHLPDPATASEAQLEMAGGVLQARRFPEDALDYYQYALRRGGDPVTLMKKIGVVRLELRQNVLARTIFEQCVHLSKKDSQAWNNLGATDYSMGRYLSAISEYKRAVKLNKGSAVYHANLGMAYFTNNDVQSAQTEFATAVRLDPRIMDPQNSGGMTLHVLQTQNYGKLCFEIAKLYASKGDIAETELWLQKAAEHGLNLREELSADPGMRIWLNNAEVRVLMINTARLQKHGTGAIPTLGAGTESVPN